MKRILIILFTLISSLSYGQALHCTFYTQDDSLTYAKFLGTLTAQTMIAPHTMVLDPCRDNTGAYSYVNGVWYVYNGSAWVPLSGSGGTTDTAFINATADSISKKNITDSLIGVNERLIDSMIAVRDSLISLQDQINDISSMGITVSNFHTYSALNLSNTPLSVSTDSAFSANATEQYVTSVLDDKYDKTGGPIDGDAEISGHLSVVQYVGVLDGSTGNYAKIAFDGNRMCITGTGTSMCLDFGGAPFGNAITFQTTPGTVAYLGDILDSTLLVSQYQGDTAKYNIRQEIAAVSGITGLQGDVTAAGTGTVTTTIATGAITSDKIADGTIMDADVNSSAAIAYSKLALAGHIGTADLSATGGAVAGKYLNGNNTWAVPTAVGTANGDLIGAYPNPSVASTVVKTVVLNTPATLYTGNVTFTTASNTATGALTLATQNPNTFFAGPLTGTTTPTFRALTNADLPPSGITAGTYGDTAHNTQITYNGQGVATAITTVTTNSGIHSYTYTPTVTGFSVTPTFNCQYHDDGVYESICIGITGISNLNSFTATLPNGVLAKWSHFYFGRITSNATPAIVMMGTTAGSNILTMYAGSSTTTGQVAWSLTGGKVIDGCFTFEKQ